MTSPLTRAALLIAGLALSASTASAQTFSDPTDIDNAFAPFRADAIKIFGGRSEGARTMTIVTHLEKSRTFSWGLVEVECCVREEREFEDGELVEIATSYLAQDDEGNVHLFGEVSVIYADGEVEEVEEDSWVVGELQPEDPAEIQSADDPAMFMPASLEVGDVFQMDPDGDETMTVLATDKKLKTRAGKYTTAVKLRESNPTESNQDETTWVVPGIGIVKELDVDGRQQLVATSLLEQLDD